MNTNSLTQYRHHRILYGIFYIFFIFLFIFFFFPLFCNPRTLSFNLRSLSHIHTQPPFSLRLASFWPPNIHSLIPLQKHANNRRNIQIQTTWEDDGDSGSKEVDGDGGCVRTGVWCWTVTVVVVHFHIERNVRENNTEERYKKWCCVFT